MRPNKVWKVISSTKRMGGDGPPLEEFFLVAISDKSDALAALRMRRPDLERSAFNVVGEASANYVEWLNLKNNDIVCLAGVP
jgi:hypothetical protein